MAEVQKLCVVEDTFFITGRGPVILCGQWETGQISQGDWIELRSATGERHLAWVKSIEGRRGHPGGLLLMGIERMFINRGDEVWSVGDPPAEEIKTSIKLILSQNSWDYIQQNVMPSVTDAEVVEVMPVLPENNDPRPTNSRVQITLSEAASEQIVNELTTLLCSKGLNSDSEPNDLGRYIEHLIDVLSTELYSKEIIP